MSRRSVWFSVLRRQGANEPAGRREPARETTPAPSLLRGRWRVHDDDDRYGDIYFPAARTHGGPYIEVTE